MATDGVKIIDGDLARDTYEGIMDLYDQEASIETIKKEIPFVKTDLGEDTDFHHEIFVTSYALAFWEIGELTSEMLEEVKKMIALGAGVKVWTEECNEAEGRKRQKELEKLLRKISQPNTKIRKRKKHKIIKNLFFQPDDLLAFKLSDDNYYAVVCAKVTQQRGRCTYDLVATTYKDRKKPSEKDLLSCCLAGRTIGSGFDVETTMSHQPGVDEIWKHKGRINFFFGLPYHLVTHKDMLGFKDRFEKVGKLKVKESFKQDGGYGYESSFERFEQIFIDLDGYMRTFGQERYPVELLCEV